MEGKKTQDELEVKGGGGGCGVDGGKGSKFLLTYYRARVRVRGQKQKM